MRQFDDDGPAHGTKEFIVLYNVPLLFTPQPEGGYVVTSPVLPELITEGDTLEEAWSNIPDALAAVKELYEDTGKPMPAQITIANGGGSIAANSLVAAL